MHLLCDFHSLQENRARGFHFSHQQRQVNLIVVRRADKAYAYLNTCPHRGIPLEWQADEFMDINQHYLQCATHGALFLVESGECIAGPCQGESLVPQPLHLDEQGQLWWSADQD
ncbi:Rieske (2Fe-2S) protein [Balneatrix alpica]|uniref:Rieske (2Fe-2S) protein n=1 Tax=Balneatrix alpica TaxID=75684 RepID=A0ABV5ZBJ5_9GAMM|nr:Rieske (2Fe-2S) protein [Balneatrix alpica]